MKTKIIKDQKQTRTTIPAKLVKQAGVKTGHVAEWKIKKGKLSADVMSHEEFMELAEEESSLPAQTKKALGPESPEDDAVYTKDEIFDHNMKTLAKIVDKEVKE